MSIITVTLAAIPLKLLPPWEWGELVSVFTLDGKSAMVRAGISEIVTPTSQSLQMVIASPPQDSQEQDHWLHPGNLQITKKVLPKMKY